MSMMPPPFSADPSDDEGIPAADAGAGAPSPAPGFGVAGEEPDEVLAEYPGDDRTADAGSPFRTPEPREIGPDPSR